MSRDLSVKTNLEMPALNRPNAIVAFEGIPGAGKTTLLEKLAALNPNITIDCEPIQVWQNFHGNNVLDLYYKDPKKYAFVFQSLIQSSVFNSRRQSVPTKGIYLLERSLGSSFNVFSRLALNENILTDLEFGVLHEQHRVLSEAEVLCGIAADLYVYLRIDPKIALERVRMRGRKEETNVTLSYLQQLHNYYEDWLIKGRYGHTAPVLVVQMK